LIHPQSAVALTIDIGVERGLVKTKEMSRMAAGAAAGITNVS
jgi:hypothetical protein